MQGFTLDVLGERISFTDDADIPRIERACTLVEERFASLRFHGGQLSKDVLLTYLVLGLADDLLQSYGQFAEVQKRLDALLTKLDIPLS